MDACPKANSLSSSDSHLEIGHRWSTSIILIVSGTVNLQFQVPFVSISLRPILGIVTAYAMATAWSSCSSFLPPGGGFSICKTACRIRLRILSIALKEDLKVLDYV